MTATVVLVPPPGAWNAAALTLEVAIGLAGALPPEVAISWWAPGHDDAWLADHDLRAAQLTDRVALARGARPPRATVVVHTGVRARVEVDGATSAAVVGLGVDGVGAFAVEDLVDRAVAAVDAHPAATETSGL